MMMKKTIEQRVAETILQEPVSFEVDGRVYSAVPPTTATLIKVSALLSRMPRIERGTTAGEILNEGLRKAKDCALIGDIAAVLMLGADGLTERRKVWKKRFFGLVRTCESVEVDLQKELANLLLHKLSPKKLRDITAELIGRMEVADFFWFTVSLSEINMTKPAAETETTASGQSSQD